jgi:7-cyano-7-deazaguanine synthase
LKAERQAEATAEGPLRAVILLSGGMDSATCLAIAQRDGFEVTALTVDYGQRHRLEIDFARRVAQSRGVVDHRVVRVDLREIGGSALTGDAEVPKDRPAPELQSELPSHIPITYVPARNSLLLSLAAGLAEVVDAGAIYIGATAVDYSGYPDCRPEFLHAFQDLVRVGTAKGLRGEPIEIRAPLLSLSKADLARLGASLGLDYGLTSSCYDPGPDGSPCERCDACQLRRKGFAEAGLVDPAQSRG